MHGRRIENFYMVMKIDDFIKRVESTAEEDFFTPRTFYHLSSSMFDEMCELLKEQEPKPMIEVEDDDFYAWSPEDVSYYCPRPECGKEISYDYNFCPYCGQAVKLNES